jgi:hypothetical protein
MDRKRLGSYEILDKLGEGGMGEVWRARDSQLNRTVAIKILPDEVWNDPARRARFEQEARSLGALNHPNIVAVYGAGQDDGCAYIVSELVDGESLRAMIDRGPLPTRSLIDIGAQIADALASAHAAGIIHRDLKPENIMVSRNGRVKVLDFGLAKQSAPAASDATATIALSQPGMVMGTVGYMSPEQVRGEPVDHRSDIFSFGAVLYEMATGKRAFQARSSVETMNAILRDDPPAIGPDTPPLPPALETILRRCLEKRPEDRFQSAADLAFALRAITSSGAVRAQPVIEPERARRAHAWRWIAAGALAAAVVFGAGWFLGHAGSRSDPPRFQRITFRKGLVTNARFTADGRNVVYSANWDGGPGRVYFAVPGNPEARDLWLPDNSIILSVSSRDDVAYITGPFLIDGSGTLGRGSISGGQMRPWLDGVRSADWSPDGSSMAVQRVSNGIYRLEYPIGKVLLDNMRYPLIAMRVSPDGSKIAYVHVDELSSVALSVVDRDGKKQKLGRISDQTPNLTDPFITWSPNGREIWFRSFDPNEWGTIYAMDLKGGQRVLMRVPGHATLYDVSRDGRMLLRTDSRQLGVLAAAPGSAAERDLSCLDMSTLAGISEDGTVIAASVAGESGGPKGSVYLRKTDGSPCIRLGDGAAFALSPDGKWVSTFTSVDTSTRRYVLLPTGPGEEREISIPQLKDKRVAVVYGWSRDDASLFVFGPGNSGWRNYFWNPGSGTLKPIGPDAVNDSLAIVSPDRQHILLKTGDGRWWVYPIDGGEGRLVPGLSPHDIPRGWRADGRSLYVVTHHDENKTIPVSILDIETGRTTPWKEIHPARPVDQAMNLMITPDGRAYAYNFLVKTSDLYIAEGVR